jgi:hypothetical protein
VSSILTHVLNDIYLNSSNVKKRAERRGSGVTIRWANKMAGRKNTESLWKKLKDFVLKNPTGITTAFLLKYK